MTQLSNLNNILIIFIVMLLQISCDKTVNDNSCSGNQVRDNCGICRLPDDEDYNSCYDECGIQYGNSDCTDLGICMGYCECAGCGSVGNPNYDTDRLFTYQCACDNESLTSIYNITDLYSNHTVNFSLTTEGAPYYNELNIGNNIDATFKIDCQELDLEDYMLLANQSITINSNSSDFSSSSYTINIFDNSDILVSSITILTSQYPIEYFENILEGCNICHCSDDDEIYCDD